MERRAIAAGHGALALGPRASQQWSSGMSYTVGWMGQAEQQLAAWIPADARALQRSEMRSAIITGVIALGALVLVLQGALFAVRSRARRRRRPEAVAALEGAGAPRPVGAGAVSAGHETARPAEPLALADVLGAAAAEIAEHGRVTLDVQEGVYLSGSAATDTEHLLTELLDNAIAFSPETAQVIVSGHAVYGGGSLVTVTDCGPGMSEEELTLLNRQLASPSLADMTGAPHMGLFTVAHLAARHGITVTLTAPLDGGTIAEVYLPDALISVDAEPAGWQLEADEAPLAGASEHAAVGREAGASRELSPELAGLLFPARRFSSGPLPPLGPETGTRQVVPVPETGTRQVVPVLLGAPLPAPAPATAETEAMAAAQGDGSPIFESIRSGYRDALGRDPLRFRGQQADQPPARQPATLPASWDDGAPGQSAKPPASWGDGAGRAAAAPPAAGRLASGLPQRLPPSGPVRGPAAGR